MDSQSIYQKNFAVIALKWPQLADLIDALVVDFDRFELLQGNNAALVCDGMQINSSYDSDAEAQIIVSQIPENAKHVHVYGVGSGQVIERLLKANKNVTAYIFDLMLFKVTLQVFSCQHWLAEEKLQLTLAKNRRHVTKPFVAIPAELMVCEEAAATLRDRVTLELDSQYVAQETCFENPELKQRIEPNLTLLASDNDITAYPLPTDKLCVVAAAGPTLSFHMDWLKAMQANDNIVLIAVDAAVKPLYHQRIKPDLIVSIDRIGGDLFGEIDRAFYADIPLLYFPLLDHDFIKQWTGKRYVSFSTGQSFNPLSEHANKTRLYSGGSVIHPSIDAAVKLGAKEVLLLGADFSFINEKRHAEHTQQFSHFNPLAPKDCKHWVLNGYGERNPTYLNYRGYLRDLEHYIELHPDVIFYNGSKIGANISGTQVWPEFDNG